MAIEYHLKFGNIKGESAASKHMDEIELLSWSWGATNPTTIVGSGMSAGKVSMSDLTITKRVDKSSPKLLELCITGKHVDEVTLYCSKQTGQKTPDDFLTIKFWQVYVSSHQAGGSHGEDVGTESLSFAYGKINYDYKLQKPDGTLTSAGNVEYDLRKREQTA
ncbi:MAG: type VI secretion system tube protein Hcp [Terriglobia bacterium]|jgi:type VI secretion system secreted protein Hcp